MLSVDKNAAAARSVPAAVLTSSNPATSAQTQSPAQQRSAVGGRDEFTGAREPLRATVDKVTNKGARNQMTTGQITVNGRTYTYRSGGHGKGNLPPGEYKVTPHLWNRDTKGMVVDGVGYSFALSNKYDPRVDATRELLRIHPDGGTAGTEGCIGIVGNGAVQKQFREDMRAELQRNGGSVTLRVG